jgi:hypothetical protein
MVLKDLCSAGYESHMEYRRMHDVLKVNGKGTAGQVSLTSQKGECGANLVQRNKIQWKITSKGASG